MTKQTLLICDDEEGIREALKLILADHYTIILTEDGQQCLDILKNTSDVSLVLIDIKMPKVNGLEILKEIKSRYPPLRVLVITGYRSIETAAEATNLGACGYIVKPFKSDEILEAVRKHIK